MSSIRKKAGAETRVAASGAADSASTAGATTELGGGVTVVSSDEVKDLMARFTEQQKLVKALTEKVDTLERSHGDSFTTASTEEQKVNFIDPYQFSSSTCGDPDVASLTEDVRATRVLTNNPKLEFLKGAITLASHVKVLKALQHHSEAHGGLPMKWFRTAIDGEAREALQMFNEICGNGAMPTDAVGWLKLLLQYGDKMGPTVQENLKTVKSYFAHLDHTVPSREKALMEIARVAREVMDGYRTSNERSRGTMDARKSATNSFLSNIPQPVADFVKQKLNIPDSGAVGNTVRFSALRDAAIEAVGERYDSDDISLRNCFRSTRGQAGAGDSASGRRAGDGGAARTCFKCKKAGHFAKSCPDGDGGDGGAGGESKAAAPASDAGTQKRAGTTGSAGAATTPRVTVTPPAGRQGGAATAQESFCKNCNKSGHFKSACEQVCRFDTNGGKCKFADCRVPKHASK